MADETGADLAEETATTHAAVAILAADGPAQDGPADGVLADGVLADDVLADDVLVEEVSIDGMCGVY
jgi:mycofactocin precursor